MRYLRKFKGDDITANDLMPITLDSLSLEIPRMKETKDSKNKLDQLPIRIKTRFRGGRNAPGRRVVSTPIFDLVAPNTDMGLLPPPMIHETSSISSSKVMPKVMPKARRSLPPLPKMSPESKQKGLPPVPRIRQVSMPVTIDKSFHGHNQSRESYSSIIDIYKQNAPFGCIPPSTHIHHESLAFSLESSPEAEVSSSGSGSEYSFDDTADEVITRHAHSPQSSITSQDSVGSHTKPTPDSMNPHVSIPYPRTYDAPSRDLPYLPKLDMPKRKPPPKSISQQHLEAVTNQRAYPPLPQQRVKQRPVSCSTPQDSRVQMSRINDHPNMRPYPLANYRPTPTRVVSQPVGSLLAN